MYPADGDSQLGRLSILNPTATALLGLSVGESLEWRSLDGELRAVTLEQVVYQPEAVGRLELYPNDKFFAEFNVDGLLRGDAKARADFYQKGITTGWLARNEARALENLNARPGADELLQPLNMAPAASMDEAQDPSSDKPPGALLLDHRGRWLPRAR